MREAVVQRETVSSTFNTRLWALEVKVINGIQKVLVLDSYGDAHIAKVVGYNYNHWGPGEFEVSIVVKLPQYPEKKPAEPPPDIKPWFATVVYPPFANGDKRRAIIDCVTAIGQIKPIDQRG